MSGIRLSPVLVPFSPQAAEKRSPSSRTMASAISEPEPTSLRGEPSIVLSPLFATDFFWPSCYIQFRLGRPMYVSNVLKCRARSLSRFFLLV
jgi:hypothetical protein